MDELYKAFDSSQAEANEALELLKAAGLLHEYETLKKHLWDAATLVNNQLLVIKAKDRKLEKLTSESAVDKQISLLVSDGQGRKARAAQIRRRRKESRGGQKKGRSGENTKQIAMQKIKEWLLAEPLLSQTKAAKILVADSWDNQNIYGRPISESSARSYYREVKRLGV